MVIPIIGFEPAFLREMVISYPLGSFTRISFPFWYLQRTGGSFLVFVILRSPINWRLKSKNFLRLTKNPAFLRLQNNDSLGYLDPIQVVRFRQKGMKKMKPYI